MSNGHIIIDYYNVPKWFASYGKLFYHIYLNCILLSYSHIYNSRFLTKQKLFFRIYFTSVMYLIQFMIFLPSVAGLHHYLNLIIPFYYVDCAIFYFIYINRFYVYLLMFFWGNMWGLTCLWATVNYFTFVCPDPHVVPISISSVPCTVYPFYHVRLRFCWMFVILWYCTCFLWSNK